MTLQLDVRTLDLSTASLFLSLAVVRFLSRPTYGSVPGFRAWMVSDIALGLGLAVRGVGGSLPAASVLASNFLYVVGLEVRYTGVRQFLRLAPGRRVALLPDLIYLLLSVALVDQAGPRAAQVVRLPLLYGTLCYIQVRTTWPLLRRNAGALTRDAKLLGIVTGIEASLTAIAVLVFIVHPLRMPLWAAGNWVAWYFFTFGISVAAWSLVSFVLASAWIEMHRAAAVEAKRKSEEQFRVLLEESPIPTVVLAPGGWIEHLNRKFVENTGYALEDIPDEDHWWALTCPGSEQRAAAARKVWHEAITLAGIGEPNDAANEVVLDFRDRPSRTIDLHARRVGDRVILQLVDVSLLKAAMQAREEMLAVVSHDLRSPVSAILLRAQMLLRSEVDPKRVGQVQGIRQSASSMEQMIRELLDAASLESGRLRLDLAPVDLAGLIGSVAELLSPLASQHSDRITCEVAPLGDVVCDGDRLRRALTNLVGNAVKFTDEGTITIRAGRCCDDGVLVSVADTGSGIAPEVLPHVFERYFTTARGQGGTGLGLYIAKGIVQAHGGRIWATSEPGKGSTFSFVLPKPANESKLLQPTERGEER
jgi:signal transduction histidine kinase